ncbi:GoLoco motif [Trinorchestia longiramus]|nr:GoLoco motif [Trinorchestia longiramus]
MRTDRSYAMQISESFPGSYVLTDTAKAGVDGGTLFYHQDAPLPGTRDDKLGKRETPHDLFDLIRRVQDSRIDDQRCELPNFISQAARGLTCPLRVCCTCCDNSLLAHCVCVALAVITAYLPTACVLHLL